MRTITSILLAVFIFDTGSYAQMNPASINQQPKKQTKSIGIGLKAGINFAKVTNASSINASNRSGFNAGVFYSPGGNSKQVLGYRSELLYSRQGYDYKKG